MGGEATHQRPNAQQQDHLEETNGFTRTVDALTPAVVASFSGERPTRATYSAASPLLLAAAVIVAIDFSPTRDMILKFALLYSLFVLVHGTPVALAPTVVLKRQPRFLILGVVALIVAMWAYGRSLGIDLVGLWLMIAGGPDRGGPAAEHAAPARGRTHRLRRHVALLYGLGAGVAYATLYVVDAIGPIRFAREDLASLP